MNFYETLGISSEATQDEIKSAYRRLAAKHHPDKGGDTTTFQSIAQAYDTLINPQKRQAYDAEQRGDHFGHHFKFTGDINDFVNLFRKGQHFRQPHIRKNRDLNIRVQLTLEQSYTGVELDATFQTSPGKKETVLIKVPAGVQHGQTVRYQNLGDFNDQSLPRGHLFVTFIVKPTENFERNLDNLIVYVIINPIEAMIGCTKQVKNLDGTILNLEIKPGSQHGTEYVIKGRGFNNLKGSVGDLIMVTAINVPAITSKDAKEQLEKLSREIFQK